MEPDRWLRQGSYEPISVLKNIHNNVYFMGVGGVLVSVGVWKPEALDPLDLESKVLVLGWLCECQELNHVSASN